MLRGPLQGVAGHRRTLARTGTSFPESRARGPSKSRRSLCPKHSREDKQRRRPLYRRGGALRYARWAKPLIFARFAERPGVGGRYAPSDCCSRVPRCADIGWSRPSARSKDISPGECMKKRTGTMRRKLVLRPHPGHLAPRHAVCIPPARTRASPRVSTPRIDAR
jgi:hypothetical protein